MTYPDHTFENAAREAGANVQVLWEQKGPENTEVAWIHAVLVNSTVCMVQTFGEDLGWELYSPCNCNNVDQTIADGLKRCGAIEPNPDEVTVNLSYDMTTIETIIVGQLVTDILTQGLVVRVEDEEGEMHGPFTTHHEIMGALGSTGDENLVLYPNEKDGLADHIGWFRLIFGNEVDVISDYKDTEGCEGLVKNAYALATRIQEGS